MGICVSRRSKVDTSITSTGTQSAETKIPNDSSRALAVSHTASSSGTSVYTESIPSTPKVENDLRLSSKLKKFSFSELKSATRNFRPESVLGGGGFGYVFKGWIEENGTAPVKPGTGLTVAVKTLNPDGLQGHKEWLAEVNFLGQLHHPNLVKLIGYCIEDDQRLLVYEYMPRGSLENHLFRRALPLPWSTRMKIALAAAKGLAYLHGGSEKPVIYRDFKTSNILLDADYIAKLSDFGLAKDGPEGDKTHVSTRVMGTYGYAAPEYVMTGHLTSRSDVYSFGVVLLEMLTGRRSMDKNRPSGEQNLVEWARPYLMEKRKLYRLVDPRLSGHYSIKGAQKTAQLAHYCISRDPKARPSMDDVVEALTPLLNLNCCTSSGGKNKKKKIKPAIAGRKVKNNSPTARISVLKECLHQSIEERYELGKVLGQGEFGITYSCIDKETQEVLACKSISKSKLRSAVDVEDVQREVAIMKHLPKHSNIVCLKTACEDENAVHLVMELCEGGELFDRIVARGHYTERAAALLTRTIVEVVQLCHQHGVIHRDLKPENFLFANQKENSALKAIDFGLSVFFKPGDRFSELVGSPYYMAPEVLKRNYGPEVDVWSAGVILYILLCGVPPFYDETETGVAHAIIRGDPDFKRDPWPQVSENAKNLVRHMLEPDPNLRLTAQQVLDHPWLQNAKKASNVPLGDVVKTRLTQFSMMNKFKKRALRVMAEHLSVEEAEDIKVMFGKMDTDNSGSISFEKMKTGLHTLGYQMADSEVQILMDAADADGNGTLDYGEFVAASIHFQGMENDDYLHKAFLYFDNDGSGYIEIEEFKEALANDYGSNNTDVVNDIFHEVDADKDGRISYEDFALMMKTGTDWRKASRHYSRGRFNSLSLKLMKDGSLHKENNEKR